MYMNLKYGLLLIYYLIESVFIIYFIFKPTLIYLPFTLANKPIFAFVFVSQQLSWLNRFRFSSSSFSRVSSSKIKDNMLRILFV